MIFMCPLDVVRKQRCKVPADRGNKSKKSSFQCFYLVSDRSPVPQNIFLKLRMKRNEADSLILFNFI